MYWNRDHSVLECTQKDGYLHHFPCKYRLWWSIQDVSDVFFRKFFACGAIYELIKNYIDQISFHFSFVQTSCYETQLLLIYYCHFLIFIGGPPQILVVSQLGPLFYLCFEWEGGGQMRQVCSQQQLFLIPTTQFHLPQPNPTKPIYC